MDTSPESAAAESPKPDPCATIIRAGWVTIATGFVAALICAIVLSQEIRSLEEAFSSFHRWSQFVMLAGCVLLAIGYRIRHESRARKWKRDQARLNAKRDDIVPATLVEPLSTVQHTSLPPSS